MEVDVGQATAAKSMTSWFMKQRWKSRAETQDRGRVPRDYQTPLFHSATPIFSIYISIIIARVSPARKRTLAKVLSHEIYEVPMLRKNGGRKCVEEENRSSCEQRGSLFRWLFETSCASSTMFAKLYRIFYPNFSQYWSKFSKLKITIYWFKCLLCYQSSTTFAHSFCDYVTLVRNSFSILMTNCYLPRDFNFNGSSPQRRPVILAAAADEWLKLIRQGLGALAVRGVDTLFQEAIVITLGSPMRACLGGNF